MNKPYEASNHGLSQHLKCDFRKNIKDDYKRFIVEQSSRFPSNDCLKMDLHCHDYNSDVPDELLGRILKLPETWLETNNLIKTLESNQCSALTVTNHNNARSCWSLKDLGMDVLAAAEFTCYFPEDKLFVHVLSYGFTPGQEFLLNQKRHNIYHFLAYCVEHELPVSLAHPLYFYSKNQDISMATFEKFALLFQSFEVMNGQRDYWQNILTKEWVESLSPECCEDYAKKHDINPLNFGVNINKPRILTGGSDDHMGIFAGECGSYLYVPNLQQRLKTNSKADLALEALRLGQVAPYGTIYENQKLNIALMDYFAQVSTKMKDPGMLRILFHRGSTKDKIISFLFSNFIQELQRHGKTKMFFKFIHNALTGKKLNKLYTWRISKDYKFSVRHLDNISSARRKSSQQFIKVTDTAIAELFTSLNLLIIKRVKHFFTANDANKNLSQTNKKSFSMTDLSTEELVRQFELPSHLREMFSGKKTVLSDGMVNLNLGKIFDDLSFPVLVSIVIAGSMMTSTRLLYQNRRFLNQFTDYIGKYPHPKKTLWLTDTLFDKNGVSSSLQLLLSEVQQRSLAIDFLICHEQEKSQEHLHVVRPLSSFSVQSLSDQVFNFPDFLEIKNIFHQGGYDRIICSTEAPMGIIGLMLKHTFNVPCYFYMHTDWLEFIKMNTKLKHSERDRIRRLLRMYYQQFDGIFVLNSDHKQWLASHEMQIKKDKIFLTAHWVADKGVADKSASPSQNISSICSADLFAELGLDSLKPPPCLFYAGRLSREKGVFDLPDIFRQVKKQLPDIHIVIAGTGPAEERLRERLPEASFLGWVNQDKLAQLYQHLDLFIFPSRFDTFGNVVLEAFSYAMPVIAYNMKGPKDIIEHDKNGYLVADKNTMAEMIIHHFGADVERSVVKNNARERSQADCYQIDNILEQLQCDLGMVD